MKYCVYLLWDQELAVGRLGKVDAKPVTICPSNASMTFFACLCVCVQVGLFFFSLFFSRRRLYGRGRGFLVTTGPWSLVNIIAHRFWEQNPCVAILEHI